MTRSEVGRSQRAASRLAYAPPTGGEALGPPAIQGAAERVTVRADRAVVRLGLRTLVVAGLAGAAWLLCANAAQAADAPATDRTSHLSAVDLLATIGADGADVGSASERAATAAAALAEPVTDVVSPAHQPVLDAAASALPPIARAAHAPAIAHPALPAGAIGSTTPGWPDGATAPARDGHTAASGRDASNDAGVEDLLGTARGLLAPLDVTDRMAGPALTRVVGRAGLNGLLRPVYGGSPPTARVSDPPRQGLRSAAGPTPARGERRTPAAGDGVLPVATVPVNDDRGQTVMPGAGATRDRASSGSTADAEPFPAGSPAGGSGTPDVPSRPSSAPMRGWVGTGSSTTGSSVPAEGGGYAVVPTSAMDNAAAMLRPPVPADVEVLRPDAEAPTVSPD